MEKQENIIIEWKNKVKLKIKKYNNNKIPATRKQKKFIRRKNNQNGKELLSYPCNYQL